MQRSPAVVLGALFCVFLVPSASYACTLPQDFHYNDQARVDESELVVSGTVIRTDVEPEGSSKPGPTGTYLRKTLFKVSKVYKGSIEQKDITIYVQTNAVDCPWPVFKDGEQVTLALDQDTNGVIKANLSPGLTDNKVLAKLEEHAKVPPATASNVSESHTSPKIEKHASTKVVGKGKVGDTRLAPNAKDYDSTTSTDNATPSKILMPFKFLEFWINKIFNF